MASRSLTQRTSAAPRLSVRVLIAVIAFHLLLGALATIWVVAKYSAGHKLTFHAGPPSPNRSERAFEHRVELQQRRQAFSAAPSLPRRILSSGLTNVALPPMPEIQSPQTTGPTMSAGGLVSGFASSSHMDGGIARAGGTAINFFGIRDVSNRVVIMIDVSDSMFTRTGDAAGRKLVRQGKEQAFQAVRDEAIRLVQSLGPQTYFDVVRWAGSARAWQAQLVPATAENQAAAVAHIQNEIDFKSGKPEPGKPGGTRHDYALQLVFSLKPETIYLLSDGNATAYQPGGGLKNIPPAELYKVAEEGQKTLPTRARLHAIYYIDAKEKKTEREMLQQLAARNGGQFKTVAAKSGS